MAFDFENAAIMDDTDFGADFLGSNIDEAFSGGLNIDSSWIDNIWSAIGSDTAKNLLNIGSGIYGLSQADKLKQLSRQAMGASDPFGSQRAGYAAQLAALMKDPSSLAEEPGYKFQFAQGQQAVTRNMASRGFLDSGNEAVALTEYGQGFAQNYRNKRVEELSLLSGAGISPSFGASLSGYASGIDTASQALASLGYGATMAGDRGTASSSGTSTPRRPNSAGGEAAAIGGIAKGVGGIVKSVGGSSVVGKIGGGISSAGGLISGISEGGSKGYGSAVGAGANLASLAGAGGTGTSAVGVAGNLVSGNYAGAASGIAGMAGADFSAISSGAAANAALADAGFTGAAGSSAGAASAIAGSGLSTAVPLAALGFAVAGVLNHAFSDSGSSKRNQAAWDANFPTTKYIQAGKAARYTLLPDGRLITGTDFNNLKGSFYGAAYAPDGQQGDWINKFKDYNSSIKSASIANPEYFSKHFLPDYSYDSSTGLWTKKP